MIPFIFLIIVAVLIMLIFAFILKNYPIGILSAMAMVVIGVYILSLGIEGVNNILTLTLGIILTCLGLYIFINGTIQQYEDEF